MPFSWPRARARIVFEDPVSDGASRSTTHEFAVGNFVSSRGPDSGGKPARTKQNKQTEKKKIKTHGEVQNARKSFRSRPRLYLYGSPSRTSPYEKYAKRKKKKLISIRNNTEMIGKKSYGKCTTVGRRGRNVRTCFFFFRLFFRPPSRPPARCKPANRPRAAGDRRQTALVPGPPPRLSPRRRRRAARRDGVRPRSDATAQTEPVRRPSRLQLVLCVAAADITISVLKIVLLIFFQII